MNLSKWMLMASIAMIAAACSSKPKQGADLPVEMPEIDSVETATPAAEDSLPKPGDFNYKYSGAEEIREYMKSLPDADKYKGGIIETIQNNVPSYAGKLLANEHPRFLVVDKASMRVLLYDKYGHLEKSYGMACARNYGTKHKKADSRTPEGFFSVEGKYNSTEWLYTDDNGVTSEKKGQFGPRFIRIKIPNTSQIGIHGTCSPWSIGHRASHGCIRITNENILELVDLVEVGMPVIILPGKRDRQVNRHEGYDIAYFPTGAEYAMSEEEAALRPRDRAVVEREERIRMEKERQMAALKALEDSTAKEEALRQVSVEEINTNENPKDSI